MNNFRFLFFLYYYPPTPGTAAKRNFRIASFISKFVSSSHTFTSSTSSKDLTQKENISVETLPTFDYRYFLRRRTKDGAVPEHKKKSGSAQTIIRLINSFPINILAGEGGLIYFFNAVRKGKAIIKRDKITHLYSSYRPFADHYAAYWLKKAYPQLVWIADFRDLIIDPHYNHILFPQQHHTFYKKIFSKADLLTTVSDGLAKQLKAYNKNVITLKNGITGEITQPQPNPSPSFTIAYTGSMFLDKRNAQPVFKALHDLMTEGKIERAHVQLIYAGKDSVHWNNLARQYKFEALFSDRGIITSEEATDIQKNACINLLLTISSDELQGVLTGKMIEYIESGSPVLAIVVGQNDPELQAILQELEIGKSFSDQLVDHTGIKEFILTEYNAWKATGMNRKPVNIDVLKSNYSQESTMKSLVEALV